MKTDRLCTHMYTQQSIVCAECGGRAEAGASGPKTEFAIYLRNRGWKIRNGRAFCSDACINEYKETPNV